MISISQLKEVQALLENLPTTSKSEGGDLDAGGSKGWTVSKHHH